MCDSLGFVQHELVVALQGDVIWRDLLVQHLQCLRTTAKRGCEDRELIHHWTVAPAQDFIKVARLIPDPSVQKQTSIVSQLSSGYHLSG